MDGNLSMIRHHSQLCKDKNPKLSMILIPSTRKLLQNLTWRDITPICIGTLRILMTTFLWFQLQESQEKVFRIFYLFWSSMQHQFPESLKKLKSRKTSSTAQLWRSRWSKVTEQQSIAFLLTVKSEKRIKSFSLVSKAPSLQRSKPYWLLIPWNKWESRMNTFIMLKFTPLMVWRFQLLV